MDNFLCVDGTRALMFFYQDGEVPGAEGAL